MSSRKAVQMKFSLRRATVIDRPFNQAITNNITGCYIQHIGRASLPRGYNYLRRYLVNNCDLPCDGIATDKPGAVHHVGDKPDGKYACMIKNMLPVIER